jgi:hypothetical protein
MVLDSVVNSSEIMEVNTKERRSPRSTLKPGWEGRAVAARDNPLPMPRKHSSISTNASSSVATTKSLSSKTDFTLPSPTNSQGKPKWNACTVTRITDASEYRAVRATDHDEKPLEIEEDYTPHQQEPKKGSIVRPRDGAHAKPNSELSQTGFSDHTGTSYGSITLGGANSLSSTDTFQNSSILPLDHSQCNGSILKRDEAEDGESQNTFLHSNAANQDGQIPHSIQHYHTYGYLHQTIVEEGDWSSTSTGNDEIYSIHQEAVRDSKKDCPVIRNKRGFSSASKRKSKKIISPAATKKNKKKKAPPTDSRPKKKPNSPSKTTKKRKKNPEMIKSNNPLLSPKSDSVGACDETLRESHEVQCMSSKWTSTSFATDPNKGGGHWANVHIDLSSWKSTDDDSLLEKHKKNPQQKTVPVTKNKRFVKRQSNWKSPLLSEEDAVHVPVTTLDGKPRSAYDKNAEWYCGSDDDKDSVMSDGSSVLSAFRPKKSTLVTPCMPESEASMDFDALLGDELEGSSRPTTTEDSIGLNFLQQCQDQYQMKSLSGLMSKIEEGSMQSFGGIELMNEPFETRGVKDLETSKLPESIPSSVNVSETETCSHHGSARSVTSLGGNDESRTTGNNESYVTKLISQGIFRWIMIAILLILVLDIVLISIFLVGRNKGGDDPDRRDLLRSHNT